LNHPEQAEYQPLAPGTKEEGERGSTLLNFLDKEEGSPTHKEELFPSLVPETKDPVQTLIESTGGWRRELAGRWIEYRKSSGYKRLSLITWKTTLKKWEAMGQSTVESLVDIAITNGWQGWNQPGALAQLQRQNERNNRTKNRPPVDRNAGTVTEGLNPY
jgi:hypothetical protein